MADKTVTVKPSGGTYTTLAAAIAGELTANADLTAMEGILHIKIDGDWSATTDMSEVNIQGFTTSAAYYVHIYTDAANRAISSSWDTGRYQLIVTDPPTSGCFRFEDNHIWIDGIQMQTLYSSTAGKYGIYVANIVAANDLRISNCRIRGHVNAASNGIGLRTADADAILKVWNCIFYEWDSTGMFLDNQHTTSAVWNCVVAYNGKGVEWDVASDFKNCAVFNNTGADFQDDSTAAVIDYCASDDGGGTNEVDETVEGQDWDDNFVNAAAGDFSLKAGANLLAKCSDPSGGIFSDDINGDTRPASWSVGADDIPAAGGASIVPLVMAYHRRLRG